MPTNYSFQFYVIDPAQPPGTNTLLSPVTLNAVDQNDDGFLGMGVGDTVGGFAVTAVWIGDTVTVRSGGQTTTITGVTYYRDGADPVFMPSDGTVLVSARFRDSTFVEESTAYQVGAEPPCFVAGTPILTDSGPRPVEMLCVGDLLVTRDHGTRPLLWVGAREVPGTGRYAPVRFARGAIGNTQDLFVSPQHRMLIEGWRAQFYFGMDEVLVAARHLVNGKTICRAPLERVTYVHLLLGCHEILMAAGCPTESFWPGARMLAADPVLRREVSPLMPVTENGGRGSPLARPVLGGRAVYVLTQCQTAA